MIARLRLSTPLLGLVLGAVLFARADDSTPGRVPPEAKDAPLPDQAKARLGTPPLAERIVALLPPDYKTFLATDSTGATRRYDLATGRPVDDKKGFSPGYGQFTVSNDGTRVVKSANGPLHVHDLATGALVQEVRIPAAANTGGGPQTVALSGDGKALAVAPWGYGRTTKDGLEVHVWDVDKNEERAKIRVVHNQQATPVLSPDGKRLATWGVNAYISRPISAPGTPPSPAIADSEADNRLVQVWDVATAKEVSRLRFAGLRPTSVAFSPDGETIALSCGDGLIEVWDAKTGKARPPLLGRTGQGQKLAFSPDGKTLASVGADGSVQRWVDGKPHDITEFPNSFPALTVVGAGFAGNDRVVAWGTIGVVAVVWEAPSGKLLSTHGEHVMGIKGVGFSAGGKEVVSTGFDGRIIRWDVASGKRIGDLAIKPTRHMGGPYQGVRSPLLLSPDATRGLSYGTSPAVYDMKAGVELFSFPPDRTGRGMVGMFPSPDHSRLAVMWTAGAPGGKQHSMCTVWDTVSRRKLAELELPSSVGYGSTAAFSPDGTCLVTAAGSNDPSGRRTMVVTGWDVKSGKKLGEFDEPTWSGVSHLAAANNTSGVLLSSDGQIWGIDFDLGRKGDLIEKNVGASPIAFDADSKWLAVGVYVAEKRAHGVRLYDWPRGKALHTFAGHTGSVTALAFGPDGKTLASGSADTTVLLWDLTKLPAGK